MTRRFALSLGDPNGFGPEILLKLPAELRTEPRLQVTVSPAAGGCAAHARAASPQARWRAYRAKRRTRLSCRCLPRSDVQFVPQVWHQFARQARKTFTVKVFRNTLAAEDVSVLELRLPDDTVNKRVRRPVTLVRGGRDRRGICLASSGEGWHKLMPSFGFTPVLEDAADAAILEGFTGRRTMRCATTCRAWNITRSTAAAHPRWLVSAKVVCGGEEAGSSKNSSAMSSCLDRPQS